MKILVSILLIGCTSWCLIGSYVLYTRKKHYKDYLERKRSTDKQVVK